MGHIVDPFKITLVYKNGFLTIAYLRYLNSVGMNLNWARIKLREKENQLSSWYDRGPSNSVIVFRKRHNISERYDFGTRKNIEVGFNLSCGWTTNVMFLCFYVSLDLASVFFLLARSGRKTDGHIINIRMFIKFLMFFFCLQARPWLAKDIVTSRTTNNLGFI